MTSQQDTFISHLVELRDRLLRSILAIAVVFIVLFIYPGSGPIYDFLAAPLMQALPDGTKMIATGVITPFVVPVKITAFAALFIALPVVLYQAWAFVAPGLYAHEKRLVLPLVIASTLLFLLGVAFCYYFVFGKVFTFINSFAPQSITPAPDIEAYFSFVLTMFLAFGVTFEIPVVVVVLARAGIVSLDQLKQARPYVIVGAFVVAAVVTPPDVLSQILLAVPMWLLYELGIFVARFVIKPAGASDWTAPSDVEKERALDEADADRQNLK
jgi:sec-independent protein translocase protein TatC